MKFAHLADCHVGAWREPLLRLLTAEAFEQAIARCVEEQVDFVLIAGDLFHTAIPSLDGVKTVFKSLASLKAAGIPLYFICGSHDYSPTGKTMLDIIEDAGLGRNVFRGEVLDGVLRLEWTIDERTGVKLAGILGRANQLDSDIYSQLDRASAEAESGEKIFLFHTSLEELKPAGMVLDAAPASLLPRGCTYYAGGHVHQRLDSTIDGKRIVYPGPLFPASFSELEELRGGGFCIVEDGRVRAVDVHVREVLAATVDCGGLAPIEVTQRVLDVCEEPDGKIVTVRLKGVLAGRPTDIDWRAISDELLARGALVVLRNTSELLSPELPLTVIPSGTLEQIEERVIAEHKVDATLVRTLMAALATEQGEGEKRTAYEERVLAAAQAASKEWKPKD
jgi:DNA repair protein SbcD/Mre11